MAPSTAKKSRKKQSRLWMLKPPPPSTALKKGLDKILTGQNRKYNTARIGKLKPATLNRGLPLEATSEDAHKDSNIFRSSALKKLAFALDNSYTGETSKNQNYAIERFLRFAEKCGINKSEALPCSSELLCMWIADGVGRTGVGTASANIAALSAWHRSHDLPFDIPLKIKTIKRALKLHWPEEKQQKPVRPPISPRMMRLLAEAWADGSLREKCALAIALAAFIGQMRLGELLPASCEKVIRARLPSRSRWSLKRESDGASSIFLPWTKTTGKAGALVTLPRQAIPFDPTRAICVHFVSSPLEDSALICEYLVGGERRMLDKEIFMQMCNSIWAANGFQRITGHSFRIGGTTSLLLAGIDVQIVKGMGRWSSDAFKRYWRKVEVLFAKHASSVDWVDFDI